MKLNNSRILAAILIGILVGLLVYKTSAKVHRLGREAYLQLEAKRYDNTADIGSSPVSAILGGLILCLPAIGLYEAFVWAFERAARRNLPPAPLG